MSERIQRVIITALADIWLYRNYPGMSVWWHRKRGLLEALGFAPKDKVLRAALQPHQRDEEMK